MSDALGIYDSGQLVARAIPGGHYVDQNGVCIRCLYCDDLSCCERPAVCPEYTDTHIPEFCGCEAEITCCCGCRACQAPAEHSDGSPS